MSKIIASDILCDVTFRNSKFDKKPIVRPKPIIRINEESPYCKSADFSFPGFYRGAIKRDKLCEIFQGVEEKPLFLTRPKDGDFKFGLYKGNILYVDFKPYYLFEIKEDFPKSILFPRMNEEMACREMILTVFSNVHKFDCSSYLKFKWKPSIEENTEHIKMQIERLKGCLQIKSYPTDDEIETFARSRDLYLKLSKIGGQKKNTGKRWR